MNDGMGVKGACRLARKGEEEKARTALHCTALSLSDCAQLVDKKARRLRLVLLFMIIALREKKIRWNKSRDHQPSIFKGL